MATTAWLDPRRDGRGREEHLKKSKDGTTYLTRETLHHEALAKLSMRSTSFGRKANVEDSHLLFWWSYIVIFAIRCGCEIVCRGHEGKRHHTRALTQELNGAGWSVR